MNSFGKIFVWARAGIFIALSFIAASAEAADHEAQAWLTTGAKLRLDDKWALQLEAEGRFNNDIQRYGQTQLKTTLSRKLGKEFTAGLGYGHMISHKQDAPDVHENRIWQELTWKPATSGELKIALRTRLEERFFSSGDDTGWRVRERVKGTRPFADKAYLYGYGEAFFFLTDTDWGAESGFARWRTGAGIGFELSDKTNLEVGYVNQYEPKSDRDDYMGHFLTISLSLSP